MAQTSLSGIPSSTMTQDDLRLPAALHYAALGLILLVAGALRFLNLGGWSYWIEEFHTMRHTSEIGPFSLATVIDTRGAYYLATDAIFQLLGESAFAARLLPAVTGVLTVLLLYWVVRRTLGPSLGLLSALLLAISPWHLYWSQNARFYTLTAFLALIALFAFYWALEEDRVSWLLLSLVAIGAASLLQFACAFLYPIFLGYALLLHFGPWVKPPGLTRRIIGLFVVAPIAGYIFFEGFKVLTGQEMWLTEMYYLFFNPSTRSFIGYSSAYVMLSSALSFIGVLLGVMSIIGSFYFLLERSRLGLMLSLGAYVPLLVFMILTYIASTAVRYVFFTLPFWIILAAYGVVRIAETARQATLLRWALIGAGAIVALGLIVWKDPVIGDTQYYLSATPVVQLLLLGGIAVYLIALLGVLWRSTEGGAKVAALVGFTLIFVLVFQGVVSNFLYYNYQHGYRDNWNAVAQTLTSAAAVDDVVLGGAPPFAEFQLQRDVAYVVDALAEPERFATGTPAWLIEDKDAHSVAGTDLEPWIAQHCEQYAQWDTYTYGFDWPMRLHRCTIP